MITPTAIDLASATLATDPFTVADGLVTVQAAYSGVDGGFDIVPLQTNDDSVYNPVYDYKDEPIVWEIRPAKGITQTMSGNMTFNIPDGLNVLKLKLQCNLLSGKFGATKGTVAFTVLNEL